MRCFVEYNTESKKTRKIFCCRDYKFLIHFCRATCLQLLLETDGNTEGAISS